MVPYQSMSSLYNERNSLKEKKGCLVYGIVYEKEEYGFRVSFGFDSIPLDGFLPFEETDSLTIKVRTLEKQKIDILNIEYDML
jgi:DNA-directed RNA polymerase subunit E'/Rpb7